MRGSAKSSLHLRPWPRGPWTFTRGTPFGWKGVSVLAEYSVCSIIEQSSGEIDVKKSPYYKNGVFNVPMSEDSGNELYQHWVDQAFSSLMAALATERIPKVSASERNRHYQCAKEADDVQAHAKCVSALLEANAEEAKKIRWMKLLGKRRMRNRVIRLDLGSYDKRSVPRKGSNFENIYATRKLRRKSTFKLRRLKREVLTAKSYNLIDKNNSWQAVISDIKQYADKEQEKREAEEKLKKRLKFYKKAAADFEQEMLSQTKKGKRNLSVSAI
ncbi:hypothetical protein GCK32_000652 [Trichostrongylus colubriformis]|uniref:Uncharacterized protein n=1 Tax=Trichostrongylus colubriformis TaxID=6319 RepID=A0AAN8FMW8_TRICO